MKKQIKSFLAVTTIFFAFSIIQLSNAQTMSTYPFTAKGSFTVTTKPVDQNKTGSITIGRYAIDKILKGDLEGTSKVDMLGAGSDSGAGAYVALETVTATLNGKKGTFMLMHNGTMTKTSQQMNITVVSGCGTGELSTLEGKFTINIVGKDHFYVFEYSL